MKTVLIALTLLSLASPAAAISRYNSLTMTCEAARQAIRSEGAVILRHPSVRVKDMTLYDRYVRESRYCSVNQYAEDAYIPTRDNPRCPVLNCQLIDNLDGMIFIPRNRL